MAKFKKAFIREEEWPYLVYLDGSIETTPNRYNGNKIKKLTPRVTYKGYGRVTLSKNGRSIQVFVHRVIAETFLEPHKTGMTVNHKNGDKMDNRVCNLEWMTVRENVQHASKLNEKIVAKIREQHTKRGDGIRLSERFKVSRGLISLIVNHKIWQ